MNEQTKIDINIKLLEQAFERLKKFMQNNKTEQEQAGIVQAFEYCYELSWKIIKRVLSSKGIEVNSPKDTFREAGRNKIIEDVKKWFMFLETRNLTVHTYNVKILEEVMKIIP
ncbi:MAG: nucleotidyltransferase substrate binding protein, partial [Pelagibacterales bacterium]|nr:nucleotidyltransferase substrate binding protein [Pelagibacterales bacterium]